MFELEPVSDSVWAHTLGETIGNVAVIKLTESNVVVDSGMDPITAQALRTAAEEVTGLPTKYLIVTHHHDDHVLGNQVFEDCEIISTRQTYELMTKCITEEWTPEVMEKKAAFNPGQAEKWESLRFVLPTKTFDSIYQLNEGDKSLDIIQVDGHTVGSAYVWVPKECIVISGDIIFAERWPYGGDPTSNPYTWIKGFEQIVAREFKKLVPGHGPILSPADVKYYFDFFKEIVAVIEGLVAEGLSEEEVVNSQQLPEVPHEVNAWAKANRHVTVRRFYEFAASRINSK